jgi:ribose 5-phosphate isomerase RpiB
MRAAAGINAEQIAAARHDDDVNILGLAADFIEKGKAFAIADAFLNTAFEPAERYERRIHELEHPPTFG